MRRRAERAAGVGWREARRRHQAQVLLSSATPRPSTWKGSMESPHPLSAGGRFAFIIGSASISHHVNVIASPVLPMETIMGLEWLPGDPGQGVIHL